MAVTAVRTEKTYEKDAWIIFLIPNLAFIFTSWLFAPGSEAASGLDWDQIRTVNPRILDYIGGLHTTVSMFSILSAVLGIAVAAFPYRKGDKWAWYAYWALPVLLLGLMVNQLRFGDSGWQVVAVFLALSFLGLLLPVRKFFPKKQA